MKKQLLPLALLLGVSLTSNAQIVSELRSGIATAAAQPFLFSVNTLTDGAPKWNINYAGSYGEHTVGAFGFDGVDQQISVKGYLGNRFTFYANADLGFANSGGVTSAQQAEVIRDFVGGRQLNGARFGIGLGLNRDFSNTGGAFSRITAAFNTATWRLGGNLKFEKAFDKSRDAIDLITSLGFQHRIKDAFFAGVEIVGQDLEGFWDSEEAEGGARLWSGRQ